MFDVLVFVYENYWRGDACPELHQLGRKLSAHGFELACGALIHAFQQAEQRKGKDDAYDRQRSAYRTSHHA